MLETAKRFVIQVVPNWAEIVVTEAEDGERRRPFRFSFLCSWRVCGWQEIGWQEHMWPLIGFSFSKSVTICHTCEKDFCIMGHAKTLHFVRSLFATRALTDLRVLRKGLVGPFQYPQPILSPKLSLPSATVSSTKASWRSFLYLPPTPISLVESARIPC